MGITDKQLLTILRICENLGVEFTGTTRNEASAFISAHIEESKREEEIDSIMSEVQYQEHCFI
jgi:hypothetical protein